MAFFKNKYFKSVLYAGAGALIGYSYYHFYGCTNGCPLSSTWYITTGYGMLSGILLGFPSKPKSSDNS